MTVPPPLSSLRDGALRVGAESLRVAVRSPWTSSLPLACIEVLALEVAGHDLPLTDLTVRVAGGCFSVSELSERGDQEWFVLDPLELEAPEPGLAHDVAIAVSLAMDLHIPYLIGADGRALVVPLRCRRELHPRVEGA